MATHTIILGAGITGLTTALGLHKYLPDPKPRITIYEIRPSLSTIGGAVNLTPKALRYLDALGVYKLFQVKDVGAECKTIEMFDVYSGANYAELDFSGKDGDGIGKEGSKFRSRRVMRCEIQGAMLELVKGLKGVDVVFGKKAVRIEETERGVTLTFNDGEAVSGDRLLGCDGIHSTTRSLLIDPEREPKYTGISVAMGTSTLDPESPPLPWKTTGLVSSRRGSLMCSYFEPSRRQQFVGGVMEVADVGSRGGWKVKGENQEAIKRDLLERFASEKMPVNETILNGVTDWTLYPVFALPEGGKWISERGRAILLGDAAHAMPPQGESTGICIEDAMAFSRAMMQHQGKPPQTIFHVYEDFRRPHTDQAVKEASWRFEKVKDQGWLLYQLTMRLTPWFLWWTAGKRDADFSQDVTEVDLRIAA